MKTKGLFSLLMTLALTIPALAQEDIQVAEETQDNLVLVEPGRTEFNPHWYGGINIGTGYTVGEADFKDLVSPAGHLRIGYNFSPAFGLRGVVSGWEGRGAWLGGNQKYKFNFVQGSIDAVFNIPGIFKGFNPNRVFNPYVYAGLGLCHGFNNDEVVNLANKGYDFLYKWDKSLNSLAVRAGIGADFKVSNRAAINIEIGTNVLSDKFNSKKGSAYDWYYTASIGLTIKFGKGAKVIPPIYEQVVTQEVTTVVPVPDPAPVTPVKEEPAPAPEIKPLKVDVFFNINSATIRQEEELKIEVLASFLKSNPGTNVYITGYADKDTGTAKYNMKLSEKRALSVAEALEAQGINPDRIKTQAMGDTVQPFSINDENRVAISIAK